MNDRKICTCCDGDNQEDGESAKVVSLPTASQILCAFCAMMAGASREVMEAAGLTVLAHADDTPSAAAAIKRHSSGP